MASKKVDKSKEVDKLYKGKPKDMAKALENSGINNAKKAATTTSKASRLGKYAGYVIPYADATWDTTSGISKIRKGHPIIGAGQTLLGLTEGTLDTIDLIKDIMSAGTTTPETVARRAGTRAAKKQVKKGLKKVADDLPQVLNRFANSEFGKRAIALAKNPKANITSTLAFEGLPKISDWINETPSDPNVQDNNNGYNNQSNDQGQYVNNGGYYNQNAGPNDALTQYINSVTGKGGYTREDVNDVKQAQSQTPKDQADELRALLEYYNKLSGYDKPYQEELGKYIDNYRDLRRKDFNLNRYLLSDPYWSKMYGAYNPSETEATRLDLINKLNQSKANNLRGAYETIGGAKLAQQAGIPLSSVFANKDYMDKLGKILISQNSNEAKRYGYDIKHADKIAELLYRDTWNQNNNNTARDIANTKGLYGLGSTYLNNYPYATDPEAYSNIYNAVRGFGNTPVMQFGSPKNNLIQPNYRNDLRKTSN